jgi:hypothetical protein
LRTTARPARRAAALAVGLALASTAGAVTAPAASAAGTDVPTVSGPVTGGTKDHPFFSFASQPSPIDLAAHGYVEEEYFLSGTASSYTPTGPLGTDGRWSVAPDRRADYVTRLLVIRPADAEDFNGTALVEWNNVTAQFELFPDFALGNEEILRGGYAYVSVSAQEVGVEGPLATKAFDPQRYAALDHPGDAYSYDIFTQAGRAVRGEAQGVDVLPGLDVETVIADGESQSANRMITYVNAIQPLEHVYDGFLVHSRTAGAAALTQPSADAPTAPTVPVPSATRFRDDQPEPVLQFLAETDVATLGAAPARQLDNPRLRTWEVAGTGHVDQYWLTERSGQIVRRDQPPSYVGTQCALPANAGPQHWVFNAAIRALTTWVRGGAAPANSPQISIAGGRVQRDALGLAVGGIRTPAVDAPTQVVSGEGNTGDPFCRLYGSTTPLPAGALQSLYRNHGAYVSRVDRSAGAAVAAGWLLPEDAEQIVSQAARSDVGQR